MAKVKAGGISVSVSTGQHSQPFVRARDTHQHARHLITLAGGHCHPLAINGEKFKESNRNLTTDVQLPECQSQDSSSWRRDRWMWSQYHVFWPWTRLAYAEAIPGNFDAWICAHFLRNLLSAHKGWAQVISCPAFHIYSPKGVRPSKHSGLWKCSRKCQTGTIHSYWKPGQLSGGGVVLPIVNFKIQRSLSVYHCVHVYLCVCCQGSFHGLWATFSSTLWPETETSLSCSHPESISLSSKMVWRSVLIALTLQSVEPLITCRVLDVVTNNH